MEFAQSEAVQRLKSVPYSKNVINGHKSPDRSSWVFDISYEAKIKKFLLRDITQHRQENNFLVKPVGPIWTKLCEMYALKDVCRSAFHLFNFMTNPDVSISL